MRYHQVEATLMELMGVESKGGGAFRARLRHLRNIGLPKLPASGSGHHIDYSFRQVLEMYLAVHLETVGFTAHDAAESAMAIVGLLGVGQWQGLDQYAYVIPGKKEFTSVAGVEGLTEMMKKAPEFCLFINYSECWRALERTLNP